MNRRLLPLCVLSVGAFLLVIGHFGLWWWVGLVGVACLFIN